MKKIGILGGISSASTVDYYKKLMELHYEAHHDYYYPEVVIESLNFQYFTDLENTNAMEEYKAYILKGIRNLEAAGAELIIMAANSPHSVFPEVKPFAKVPMISIVEAVGARAKAAGLKKVLLTGIKYTMQRTFYRDGLAPFGIEVISPEEEDQDIIERIIFDELVIHKITPTAQRTFVRLIEKYVQSDHVQGVILGCTELPSLAAGLDLPVMGLNSLQIHCEETLKQVY